MGRSALQGARQRGVEVQGEQNGRNGVRERGGVGGLGAGGGLGFGFLENFGAVDAATKAAAAKWAAKNPVVTGDTKVVMSIKGHYNTELFNLETGESFWRAARRRKKNPIASTIPIDLETESHLVWGDLIRALVKENWKKANAAKKRVEVAQRLLMKEIKEGRKEWQPRLFARVKSRISASFAACTPSGQTCGKTRPSATRTGTNSSERTSSQTCERRVAGARARALAFVICCESDVVNRR